LPAKRQQALYWAIEGVPYALLYASPANSLYHILSAEERQEGLEEMLDTFRRIERLDEVCATPAEALALVPYCAEHFWDKEERKRAKRRWALPDVIDGLTILGAG
jgi:hypothetical protein